MRSWRAVAAVVLLGAVWALADSFVRIVRISLLTGESQVSHAPEPATAPRRWSQAILNAPLVEGEAIRTRNDGQAEVQLECGSALRLAPNSELTFTRLRLRSDGVRFTRVTMDFGTAFFAIQKADAPDFQTAVSDGEIATPDGAAVFRVDALPGSPTRVELIAGHARMHAGGAWLPLRRAATLELAEHTAPTFIANAAPDQWSRWNHARDELYERAMLAAQPRPPVNGAASSPPLIGVPSAASVNTLNPGGSFDSLDATMLGPDPFPISQNLPRMPYCSKN